MNARDVMTRTVISIAPDATVLQAARKMLEHHISGLPVVDKGKLVGIVSEGDFLRRRETQTQRRRSRWLEFLMGPGRMAEEYTHTHGSKVSEVMTDAVQTVTEDTSLEDIVRLMEKHHIKRVPVMHGAKMAEEYTHTHGSKVSEVMTGDVQTVTEDTSLEDIVRLMEKHHIKRVPVMQGAKMAGIVTRANLMHAMVGLARKAKPVKAGDAAIREQLMAIMQEQTWAPTAMVDVQVHDGVVELWGTILDERQRDALKVAAETIAGVKAVKDHLAWIEPISGTIVDGRDKKAAAH